jgi:hypothetical protein
MGGARVVELQSDMKQEKSKSCCAYLFLGAPDNPSILQFNPSLVFGFAVDVNAPRKVSVEIHCDKAG